MPAAEPWRHVYFDKRALCLGYLHNGESKIKTRVIIGACRNFPRIRRKKFRKKNLKELSPLIDWHTDGLFVWMKK